MHFLSQTEWKCSKEINSDAIFTFTSQHCIFVHDFKGMRQQKGALYFGIALLDHFASLHVYFVALESVSFAIMFGCSLPFNSKGNEIWHIMQEPLLNWVQIILKASRDHPGFRKHPNLVVWDTLHVIISHMFDMREFYRCDRNRVVRHRTTIWRCLIWPHFCHMRKKKIRLFLEDVWLPQYSQPQTKTITSKR